MNIFHIWFSRNVVVQTAWYGLDRFLHFSKSHWCSSTLRFPSLLIFSVSLPSVKVHTIRTPWWISLCTRPKLGTLHNVSHACSTHQQCTEMSDSASQNCDTVYTNISGELCPLKMVVAESYEMFVSSSKTTVSQSRRPQVLYLASCEPQN
jgi:hypothetical protein